MSNDAMSDNPFFFSPTNVFSKYSTSIDVVLID